jgi:hypothetical protein
MIPTKDRVQKRGLALAVLNLWVLLSEGYLCVPGRRNVDLNAESTCNPSLKGRRRRRRRGGG